MGVPSRGVDSRRSNITKCLSRSRTIMCSVICNLPTPRVRVSAARTGAWGFLYSVFWGGGGVKSLKNRPGLPLGGRMCRGWTG